MKKIIRELKIWQWMAERFIDNMEFVIGCLKERDYSPAWYTLLVTIPDLWRTSHEMAFLIFGE
jgi:hypothetical protein